MGLSEELQEQLLDEFPLHHHLRLQLVDHAGSVAVRLPDQKTTQNHLGTQAAAALFAVADAASGVALIEALRPYVSEFAGVVSGSRTEFLRPAFGSVVAVARSHLGAKALAEELCAGRKATTDVIATVTDQHGDVVCRVTVTWHLRPPSERVPSLWRRDPLDTTDV